VVAAGLEMSDLDAFVSHQANLRITDLLSRKLDRGRTRRRRRLQHLGDIGVACDRGDGQRRRCAGRLQPAGEMDADVLEH